MRISSLCNTMPDSIKTLKNCQWQSLFMSEFIAFIKRVLNNRSMSKARGHVTMKEIAERLATIFKDEGLQLVLLFGSLPSGKAHKQSDIDLAFLFDRPANVLELTNRVIRLLHTDNIDVVDLRRASSLLKFSIAKTAKVLYEKSPGTFNEFCSLAFRMYVDTKKLRDAQSKAIKYFLEARGLS